MSRASEGIKGIKHIMAKAIDKKVNAKPEKDEEVEIEEGKNVNEAKTEDIIKELIDTDFGTDNDKQGKMVQMMKGLAFSDDEIATKFMKKVSDIIGNIDVSKL